MWREAVWAELQNCPMWPNIPPALLRELRVYSGQAAGLSISADMFSGASCSLSAHKWNGRRTVHIWISPEKDQTRAV